LLLNIERSEKFVRLLYKIIIEDEVKIE